MKWKAQHRLWRAINKQFLDWLDQAGGDGRVQGNSVDGGEIEFSLWVGPCFSHLMGCRLWRMLHSATVIWRINTRETVFFLII